VQKIVCADSTIALSWVTSEKKSLAMYHKNRVIQIRRTTEIDELYHVRTEVNCADIGTRPEKVGVCDVGPGSVWEEGHDWMKLELQEAIDQGFIKPAKDLRMNKEEEEDYNRGLVFEKVPEILTRGHVVSEKRVSMLEERAAHANYLLLPTTFSFPKVVRIYSIVFSFVSKCRRGRIVLSRLLCEGKLWFSMFHSRIEDQ
jgi:hypothetical protein